MISILSVENMRKSDARTIAGGIPGRELMYRAGKGIFGQVAWKSPAAIVCDSLYYLSVDADLTRYFGKLLAMLIFTAVFVLLGFLLTRRRQYASL